MIIRRAADALGADSRIDGFGKIRILSDSTGLARVILETFAFSCRLNPAFVHPEDKTVRPFINHGLGVEAGIDPEIQGLFQTANARIFRKI